MIRISSKAMVSFLRLDGVDIDSIRRRLWEQKWFFVRATSVGEITDDDIVEFIKNTIPEALDAVRERVAAAVGPAVAAGATALLLGPFVFRFEGSLVVDIVERPQPEPVAFSDGSAA